MTSRLLDQRASLAVPCTVFVLLLSSGHDVAAQEITGWRFSEQPNATLAYEDAAAETAAFEAICAAGKIGPEVPVVLGLDTGVQEDGATVDIVFASDTFHATYVGKVREKHVQLPVGIDDPLWKILRTNETLSFKVEDGKTTSVQLDGAEAATKPFLKTCRAQFAAADAAVPETDILAETFVCEDGTTFEARFDNSRSYSVALLTLDGDPEIALIQGPSGSGVRYSNGDYTLHTKGDDALLVRGEETRRCKAE